ncbi:MAG: PAS domain-containing protein [Bacteroidales bacterium]
MSEFTHTRQDRLAKLMEVAKMLLETGNAHPFIVENRAFIDTVLPSDFIALFDEVVKGGYPMHQIKGVVNKMLNIFHKPIAAYRGLTPEPHSFLGVLALNNLQMEALLNEIRPLFKALIKDPKNAELQSSLILKFEKLERFIAHYTIKENVLFPILEAHWPDYRCLQIMWSFHDDIRRNLTSAISLLREGIPDMSVFNRSVGDIFFQMLAIRFREERILFPEILSTVAPSVLDSMNREADAMGYPYVQPDIKAEHQPEAEVAGGLVDLGTGNLLPEQIALIFNHLPVDITFVDEHNKVCYFSAPQKRIFPRTVAIIGRQVNNCHPPESVHVVEQIVESFRRGEKEHADFWIRMRGEVIYIRYFAVRDSQRLYKGVLEVSQEVSAIQALEGEKRLLDW